MHGVLYVCLPRFEAKTSPQARRKVCGYLEDEGFALQCRFGGHCDYFSVGGRWSLPSPSQPMLFRTVCFELQPLW